MAYSIQRVGLLLGWVSDYVSLGGQEWLFFVAVVSSYVLGLTLLAASGTLFKPLASKGTVTADPIEFLPFPHEHARDDEPDKLAQGRSAGIREDASGAGEELAGAPSEERAGAGGSAAASSASRSASHAGKRGGKTEGKRRRNRPSASEDAGVIRDRTSKQCRALQEQYGLSSREAEVMELIARGNSMATIAERLVISENTVRTHAKHIYTKLDIHKRQELLDMLHDLDA